MGAGKRAEGSGSLRERFPVGRGGGGMKIILPTYGAACRKRRLQGPLPTRLGQRGKPLFLPLMQIVPYRGGADWGRPMPNGF